MGDDTPQIEPNPADHADAADQYLLRRLREAETAFHALEFDAIKRLTGHEAVEAVRSIYKNYYHDLGWKRLCQLYVFKYGGDALFLAEMERRNRRKEGK